MKVYIGSSDRRKASEAALLLGAVLGHEIVSRWHESDKPKAKDVDAWTARAAGNYAALDQAEVMVGVFVGKYPGPGVHCEIGFSLGRGIPVVVLAEDGALPTPMMRHPRLTLVTTADELEAELKELAEQVTDAAKPTDKPKTGRKPRTQKKVTQ